jgi:hypothetical protein
MLKSFDDCYLGHIFISVISGDIKTISGKPQQSQYDKLRERDYKYEFNFCIGKDGVMIQ